LCGRPHPSNRLPPQAAAVVEVPHADGGVVGGRHQPPLVLVKRQRCHLAVAVRVAEAPLAGAVLRGVGKGTEPASVRGCRWHGGRRYSQFLASKPWRTLRPGTHLHAPHAHGAALVHRDRHMEGAVIQHAPQRLAVAGLVEGDHLGAEREGGGRGQGGQRVRRRFGHCAFWVSAALTTSAKAMLGSPQRMGGLRGPRAHLVVPHVGPVGRRDQPPSRVVIQQAPRARVLVARPVILRGWGQLAQRKPTSCSTRKAQAWHRHGWQGSASPHPIPAPR
jgi:hypothetical protein